jgi:hypothetical protein
MLCGMIEYDGRLPSGACTLTGSKLGWMTPRLGEAFLTSAIRPGRPVASNLARMAPIKSRPEPACFALMTKVVMGCPYFMSSTSCALNLRHGIKTSNKLCRLKSFIY